MKTSVIEKIEKQAKQIAERKHETICPGQPHRISEAATIGDGVWQGDLGIEIVASDVPRDCVLIANPTDKDRQLVPGNTTGSKHCLDSLEGVELYRPANWNEASLVGPFFRLSQERTITHPTHGAVIIPAGFSVRCRYQVNYDEQLKAARRAAD